jgi:hypothetical protein
MALSGHAFLYTSVLLGGLIEMGPASEAAQRVTNSITTGRLDPVSTAWHCCLELSAVTTRLPEEVRLSPLDAVTLLEHEVLGRFKVCDLPAAARPSLLRAAVQDRLAAGRVYDTHIAQVARSSGAAAVITESRRDSISLLRHGPSVLTAAELISDLGLDRDPE